MILMRTFILFASVFLLVLLFSPSSAQEFSVDVSKPEEVFAGKSTEFTITIDSQKDDWFSIAVVGTRPSWISLEKTNVKISAGERTTVKVYVSPSYDALQGVYIYTVIVSDTDGVRIEKDISVSVIQRLSAVLRDVELSCQLCKPGETLSVSAVAENIGSRNLEDLRLIISFNNETKTLKIEKLDALTKKIVSTKFVLPSFIKPGNYDVELKLMDAGVFDTKTERVSVPEISDIKTDKKTTSNIFGKTVIITAINKGNVQTQTEIKSLVSKEWFALYSGPAPSKKNGEYIWSVSLAPNEMKQIQYSEIYWVTYAFIVLLIVGGLFFYLQMTALSIRKKVLHKHTAREGREFAVSIELKNRGKTAKNIIIKDKVPTMFKIIGRFETLKPTIRKTENETELVWKLGSLKSGEERVLHYRIKTLVGVIGKISLPKAILRGKVADKRIVRESNRVSLRGIKE